ncbi:hypothetical protein AAC387_Pa06g1336 [Persea americana]
MASVSGAYNPSAEGQEARGKGKKGGSKDVMSSMEACLAKVELAIIGMWDQFDDTNSRIEELASVGEELEGEMQGALNESLDTLNQKDATLEAMVVAL